ncbi:MAG: hypothetical protein ACK4WH_12815 [Phycisphaerales bacterium]
MRSMTGSVAQSTAGAIETDPNLDAIVSVLPDLARWPRLVGWAGPSAEARAFREQLGLPIDRPVVMTGHQAQVWHPGILAKYLAADAYAEREGAACAWVWVDQDAHAPVLVRYPVRVNGGGEDQALSVRVWNAGGGGGGEDVPTARMPAFAPGALPVLNSGERFAAPGVERGLVEIHGALGRHVGAGSAAAQLAGAMREMLAPLVRAPGVDVLSLAISRTSLFAEVVERMRSDAGACIRTYREAVAAHPRERVAILGEDELPLWRIGREHGSPRRRVSVAELRDGRVAPSELAPKALLMTGLLRMAGCELFIHGTGGGGRAGHEGYDRITEDWLRAWLGVGLAPMAVVTATMHLRIGLAGPGIRELRRRQWLAHRARHDPSLLNDAAAADRKREFTARVREAMDTPAGAVGVYKEMHRFLADYRARHADEIRRLDEAADHATARARDAEIAHDRSWAFPLYEADQISALRERFTDLRRG